MTETTYTPLDIEAVEKRCAAATPGPENVSSGCMSMCDLLPAALEEIKQLRGMVKELREIAEFAIPFVVNSPGDYGTASMGKVLSRIPKELR